MELYEESKPEHKTKHTNRKCEVKPKPKEPIKKEPSEPIIEWNYIIDGLESLLNIFAKSLPFVLLGVGLLIGWSFFISNYDGVSVAAVQSNLTTTDLTTIVGDWVGIIPMMVAMPIIFMIIWKTFPTRY